MARGLLQHAFTAAIIIAVLGGASTVFAKTVYVSTSGNDANDGLSWAAAKQSVPAGLSAAVAGDQVWVAAGTYVGTITLKSGVELYGGFTGSETQLEDRDWTANTTILDGNQLTTVVVVQAGAANDTRIDGFTIRNGIGARGRPGGGINCNSASPIICNNTVTANRDGAIYCSAGSPKISSNIITGNNGSSGGGVYCYNSQGEISGNTIVENTASYGGGISCRASSPVIANNTITRNHGNGYGGGIECESGSVPVISGNRIYANTTTGVGAGIFCVSSDALIHSNVIARNAASLEGGGIGCSSSSTAMVICNNTIVGNTVGRTGGGINSFDAEPSIFNNLVAFNSSGVGVVNDTTQKKPVLRNNCIYNPDGPNYEDLSPGTTDSNVDPRLVAVGYWELHLSADSPCIDAGDDSFAQSAWLDVDGQARIQGAHVDIGADEFHGTVPAFGPTKVVRVSPAGNDANDGSSWALAKRTVQAGINAAAVGDPADVWVAAGTYNERITLKRWVHVYGGFAGTETDRADRDWDAHAVILDGGAAGTVVTAFSAAPSTSNPPDQARLTYGSTTIDGFTIRNGKAANGGGVYCSYSSPVIANCTIISNEAVNGGGIHCRYSSPNVIANVIASNTAGGTDVIGGGGIYCSESSPVISGNTFDGNRAVSAPGGGIYCSGGAPVISNNTITGSTGGGIAVLDTAGSISGNTISGSTGAGIRAVRCTTPISQNTISGNRAGEGGGIYANLFSGKISENIITGNEAVWYGGGIYSGYQFEASNSASSGELDVSNTNSTEYALISNNIVSGNTAFAGGGIFCEAGTISNNTITDNTATDLGGGIHRAGNCKKISGNLIARNKAAAGGGISSLSEGETFNNVIAANTASRFGGGIYSRGYRGVFSNNTIVANTSVEGAGGIHCYASGPSIFSNVVAFNSSGLSSTEPDPRYPPVLRNNCVYNPDGVEYSGLTPGLGDISLDPSFVDRLAGDYHLAPGSPCIDAGYNAGVPFVPCDEVSADFEGNPRFINDWMTSDCQWAPGNCGTAPIVDMGAYEFVPPIPGDFDGDDDVDDADLEVFEACVTGPAIPYAPDSLPEGCTLEPDGNGVFRSIAADFDRDGVVDMDDFAIFQRCWSGTEPGDYNCSGL